MIVKIFQHRFGRPILAALIAMFGLLAPAFVNGRPPTFYDTPAYFELGARILDPVVAHVAPLRVESPGNPASSAPVKDPRLALTTAAARSPFYAIPFYLTARLSPWVTAFMQAALTATVLWIVVNALLPGVSFMAFLCFAAVISATTALPVFVALGMPDFLVGLSVLSALVLLLFPERCTAGHQAVLWTVLVFAAACHTSHLLLTVSLLLTYWVSSRAVPTIVPPHGKTFTVAVAILVSVTLNIGYRASVAHFVGNIYAPPFLSARVMADGPGKAFLQTSCRRGDEFAMCRYKDIPIVDSNQILWSQKPGEGVFATASYEARMAMIREQTRFVTAAVMSDPVRQIAASLSNWGRLLVSIRLDDVVEDPAVFFRPTNSTSRHMNIAALQPCLDIPGSCAPQLPLAVLEPVTKVTLVASLLALLTFAAGLRRRSLAIDPRLNALLGFTLLAVVANAAICGILSGPFNRYQTRIDWLVVLAALIAAVAAHRSSTNVRS